MLPEDLLTSHFEGALSRAAQKDICNISGNALVRDLPNAEVERKFRIVTACFLIARPGNKPNTSPQWEDRGPGQHELAYAAKWGVP